MELTDEEINNIIGSFPVDAYKRDVFGQTYDIDEYTLFFYNYNAAIEIELCQWWEEYGEYTTLNKKTIVLTGDLEDDILFGIARVLDVTE